MTPHPYVTLVTDRPNVDRRNLDRSAPAAELTVDDPIGKFYYVRAGESLIAVDSAAEQATTIALHNILNGHATIDQARTGMRGA